MKNDHPNTWKNALPFFILLAALTVFAWQLSLRPTESAREKRVLEKFPVFSVSSLLNGDYFDQIGLWFSDTFPMRDAWIDANQRVEKLYGHSDIMIYGDARPVTLSETPAPTAVPTPVPTPVPTAVPSGTELAEAEPTPEPTPEPTEEPWNGIDLDEEELISIGPAIQIGDSVYPFGGFVPYYCEQYAQNISHAAELLEGKARVFNVLLMNNTSMMLPRDFREEIGAGFEEDAAAYANSLMTNGVINVDVYDTLIEHRDEYVFFRTDHHWTALGAYYVYCDWAEKAGFTPVPLSEYTENVYEPFYGSLFYKANQSNKLTPDTVYAYTPPGDVHLYLNFGDKDSWTNFGGETPLLQDVKGTDKYLCFLLGDQPLCTFVNNDIEEDSAVLIVKNSNGNPFSYYFAQHYKYVFVADYRKYMNRSLTDFVDYYGVDDVIFCFSTGQAQSQGGNNLLNWFIR